MAVKLRSAGRIGSRGGGTKFHISSRCGGTGNSKALVLVCIALILGGCATPKDLLSSLPVPQEVNVAAPPVGLAPEVAAFWGIWEGIWKGPSGLLASRLIVERIDAESAQVVYVWGDDPRGYFKAGWGRFEARINGGRVLEFGWLRTRMVFEMAEDRRSLEGGRVQGRDVSAILMRKVAP